MRIQKEDFSRWQFKAIGLARVAPFDGWDHAGIPGFEAVLHGGRYRIPAYRHASVVKVLLRKLLRRGAAANGNYDQTMDNPAEHALGSSAASVPRLP